ncbi:MAG: ATP-binding protein [Verrucomicrobiota bacterium]
MAEDSASLPIFSPSTRETFRRYLSTFPLVFVQFDGQIVEVNPSALLLLGFQPEECQEKNVDIFFQFLGVPQESYDQSTIFEALVTRKNSSVFPAQIHVIPFQQNQSMLILSDLSLRNRLRDQLFQEKHLLTTVIDAIQDHVFMMGSDGSYELNNKSHLKFLGVSSQEETTGKKAEDFFEAELAQKFLSDNRQILEGASLELNRTIEVHPGEWFEIKKTPLKDPLTNEVIGVVGLTRDVSERVRTEEKLRQVQRLESLGLLAGGIAHDFNNLLTVVVGLADTAALMMDTIEPNKPIKEEEVRDLKETLIEIRQAGQRAAALTQKLLAVGRKQLVEMRALSLNDVIRGMTSVLAGVLKSVEKPILIARLEHRLAVDLPAISADRSQLEQILLNLVVNARDAILKKMEDPSNADFQPLIVLRTYKDPQLKKIILEVQDNGCGMSDEVKSKVFDPFFTTKGLGRGTGLGLASVYGILQQSNASVQILSELGIGTTFQLGFEEWVGEIHSVVEKEPTVPTKSAQRKILYVEDDTVIRTLVRRNLQIQGYEVCESENGEAAWQAFQKNPTDFVLILTDLIMPKMTGVEFARKVLELNPKQKILCVSGYTNEETGGLPILNKPFTIQKLSQKIDEILSENNG